MQLTAAAGQQRASGGEPLLQAPQVVGGRAAHSRLAPQDLLLRRQVCIVGQRDARQQAMMTLLMHARQACSCGCLWTASRRWQQAGGFAVQHSCNHSQPLSAHKETLGLDCTAPGAMRQPAAPTVLGAAAACAARPLRHCPRRLLLPQPLQLAAALLQGHPRRQQRTAVLLHGVFLARQRRGHRLQARQAGAVPRQRGIVLLHVAFELAPCTQPRCSACVCAYVQHSSFAD